MGVLSGKVAVITGASSKTGIGRAIARRFAQAGASMYLVAEQGTEAQLQDAVQECNQASGQLGGRAEYGIHDLAEAGAAEEMIGRAERVFGRIDILVNNAAARAKLNFGEFSRDLVNHVIAVNLVAPFFACQAVVPIMRRQKGGRIIHIASQLGTVANDKRAVYGMTKAGLIYLAKAMAYELARDGIIVNAISPGPTLTEAVSKAMESDPRTEKQRSSYMRIDRLGRPEEIADVAFFLATEAPELLLGQNIIVDGGYTSH
jgi:NAD(P)-dependent dehydrogenase (short-subunit alcohol dehydrogenase family)